MEPAGGVAGANSAPRRYTALPGARLSTVDLALASRTELLQQATSWLATDSVAPPSSLSVDHFVMIYPAREVISPRPSTELAFSAELVAPRTDASGSSDSSDDEDERTAVPAAADPEERAFPTILHSAMETVCYPRTDPDSADGKMFASLPLFCFPSRDGMVRAMHCPREARYSISL